MTLAIRDLAVAGAPAVTVTVEPATWVQLRHRDPDLLLDALAGLQPAQGSITMGGRILSDAGPVLRARRGLVTATGRLPALPGLRVVDALLLATNVPPASAWLAALGRGRHRARLADDEAFARALAGRIGIAGWADEPATGLPEIVSALADVGRTVAARPRTVVWRAPEWLEQDARAHVVEALRVEQARWGWGVLEVRAAATQTVRGPLIIEVPA